MKYDFVFKLNCVELYRKGQWSETPEGIEKKNFRKNIVSWSKLKIFMELMPKDILRKAKKVPLKKDIIL